MLCLSMRKSGGGLEFACIALFFAFMASWTVSVVRQAISPSETRIVLDVGTDKRCACYISEDQRLEASIQSEESTCR